MHAHATESFFCTKEEYLALEDLSEFRHEYRQGEVVAMAGGTLTHGQLASNILRTLGNALANKHCRTLGSDLKVETAVSYVYPDAFVICGEVELAEGRRDIVRNPSVLVEVLSDSTEQYDRGEKFALYRSLPSFREYVLVSQHKPAVEVFFKQDDKHWLFTIIDTLDDGVTLQSLGVSLPMRDIYDKVF